MVGPTFDEHLLTGLYETVARLSDGYFTLTRAKAPSLCSELMLSEFGDYPATRHHFSDRERHPAMYLRPKHGNLTPN